MDENKDRLRKLSTCFEGSSFAEMMQKIVGAEGIGSLSEEIMRSLIESCCEGKGEPQEATKDKGDEKESK
jgi:hypothetical protein